MDGDQESLFVMAYLAAVRDGLYEHDDDAAERVDCPHCGGAILLVDDWCEDER